jgi:predicted dehydrogenase
MQGFRQSGAALGESAVVIGLGLVGQLLVRILRAASLRVIGIDLTEERCRIAETGGAIWAGSPVAGIAEIQARVAAVTEGHGADHVFLAAGVTSNEPVELAAALARDRARVVDIGKTRLDIPWKDYYEKELDLRFSRSYGPGRYDTSYEEGGIDYPIGYVRWTEARNMGAFLQLIADGSIELDSIVGAVRPFEEAVNVYDDLRSGRENALGVVFKYAETRPPSRRLEAAIKRPSTKLARQVRLGVVGAGNYATSMLLPHLARDHRVALTEVVTTSPLSAANAQQKFGFAAYGTDFETMLGRDLDAILIATRHSSHAHLVCEAIRAGKAVFVEKPLAIDVDQLASIIEAVAETGNDRLMVGFNRRFSPLLNEMKSRWTPLGPVQIRYDVNAGSLAANSWYADNAHGGRLVGELGHFIDTVSWFLESRPQTVTAVATPDDRDNAVVTIRYTDQSLASFSYFTGGHSRYPKERLQVYGQSRVASFDNFRSVELWQGSKPQTIKSRVIDKGQAAELSSFVHAVQSGGPMAISFGSLIDTTSATLAAAASIADNVEVKLDPHGFELNDEAGDASSDRR